MGEKGVHPFFIKTDGCHESGNTENHALEYPGDSQSLPIEQLDGAQEKHTKSKSKAIRTSKPYGDAAANGKKQTTLPSLLKGNGSKLAIDTTLPVKQQAEIDLLSSDPVTDGNRRKRRRTSQHASVETGDEVLLVSPTSPRVVITHASPLAADTIALPAQQSAPVTPPKKLLKLKANGKFSSPISRSRTDEQQPSVTSTSKAGGRVRKSKQTLIVKGLIVKLCYQGANRSQLADRINRILAGEERLPSLGVLKHASPKKLRTLRRPAKPTHPFFLGKQADEAPPPPKQISPRKTSAVTPGKLKQQAFNGRVRETREVPYAVGSGLFKDRLMVKHPGVKEPAWPDREETHVRSLGIELSKLIGVHLLPKFKRRKRKRANLPLSSEESVLQQKLNPEEDRVLRSDGFYEPHVSIRLPDRLLLSGHNIALRVLARLSVPIADCSIDERSRPASSLSKVHSALRNIWGRLSTSMTAFDEGKGECQPWAHKHAPTSTADVLQVGTEMEVLEVWLRSHTISAVETASRADTKLMARLERRPSKKPRRRNDGLDDFLVDSDDEIHDMNELTGPDLNTESHGRKAQNSVVQTTAGGMNVSNAVLLSGPHGSGKTAAAYAVAKQLGFKVFEISSCDRRSGKDVIDRVGDMTENHLVRHHGIADGELSDAEAARHVDEAFQKDLASGRQGKMSAFFKPQIQSNQPLQRKIAKKETLKAVQEAVKRPSKEQQQSLILLEEVDILFKDDRDFWTTVLKLIATSKRPFIMTCNDEDLVPLQSMSLHAILRFSPPPSDLSTDYLLLVAAMEGHLLEREAVHSLYQAKGCDLRASLTELDFWCQMGVGDPREGLGWIYQRWPPGSDVDEHGRKLRIVSDGTFQQSLGMLPARGLSSGDTMSWIWQEHDVAPLHLLGWNQLTITEWDAESSFQIDVDKRRRLELRRFEAFADSLSSIDAYTACGLPDSAPLDTTQPETNDKIRANYIEGLHLLQSDEQVDHSGLSRELVIAATMATYNSFGLATKIMDLTSLSMLQSLNLTKAADEDPPVLGRHDFACFDPISVPVEPASASTSGMTPSSFDGPLTPIAIDLAPYVRSIAQYDLALDEQRGQLSGLFMTQGEGRKAKRARTTRAARSAMEGSQRASTRRERWFTKDLDLAAVLATGGLNWPKATLAADDGAGSVESIGTPASSAGTS